MVRVTTSLVFTSILCLLCCAGATDVVDLEFYSRIAANKLMIGSEIANIRNAIFRSGNTVDHALRASLLAQLAALELRADYLQFAENHHQETTQLLNEVQRYC